MPDGAREVIFPDGVPVRMLETSPTPQTEAPQTMDRDKPVDEESDSVSDAEGGLHSEAEQIQEQARQSRPVEEGQNLLKSSADD
jgi:hypothetical protein